MSSVFSTGVVTKHSIASKYLRLTKEVDDAGNIPKNSLTTKLGYHLPGPFEGAIPKTVVEIETWNSGWNENLNTQKIGRRRKSSKLNTIAYGLVWGLLRTTMILGTYLKTVWQPGFSMPMMGRCSWWMQLF
jgi:hypothetical protein